MDKFRTVDEGTEEIFRFAVAAAGDQHRRYPEFTFQECLADRTMLFSFLKLCSDKTNPFRIRLLEAAAQAGKPEDMIPLLPEVQRYAKEHFAVMTAVPPEFPNGSSVRAVAHPSNSGWCYLHFYNAKRPRSFLDSDPDFAAELLNILDFAEKELKADTVFTVSWLNENPRFLRFFPEEWLVNMAPPPAPKTIIPTNGCQGQFYNSAGWLNRKTADFYLAHGVLKYARRESHCSMKNMRDHLKKMV